MLTEIINFQKKLGIKLEIVFFGSDIIINRANFINIPYPITCYDLASFKRVVTNLLAQSECSKVIYIHEQEVEEDNRPLAKVIPFKNIKDNPYAYNGYKLRESHPKELARAVSFINNIRKPVHEQDEEFKSYLLKK